MKLNIIIQGIKLLFINPFLFKKYLRYKLKQQTDPWKNFDPKKSIIKLGDIKFKIDFDHLGKKDPYVKQMYFGYYQIALISLMKKCLKKGSIFIDVGANIGYVSAVAAHLVGKSGEVHSFEPAPQYFKLLQENIKLNPDYKMFANQAALGERKTTLPMEILDPPHGGGNTLIKEYINIWDKPKYKIKTLNVNVIRLDKYIEDKKLENISFIKIDVEGYEFPVLRGLENYLSKCKKKPVILTEINPKSYELLNYDPQELINFMKKFGYKPYNVFNPFLKIDIRKLKEGTDVAFIAK